MIQLKLALCAEGVVRDAQTNAFSLFNMFEEVGSPTFPLAVPKLSFLFMLSRKHTDPAMLDAEATLTLDRQELLSSPIKIDFQQTLRARLVIVVQGLPIEAPGSLTMMVTIPGQKPIKYSIPVRRVDPPLSQLPLD